MQSEGLGREVGISRAFTLLAESVATTLWIGRWPFGAPATLASAVAVAVYWAAPFGDEGNSLWFFVLILAGFGLGVLASRRIATAAEPDPRRNVIDEWVGQWITLAFLPATWPWLVAGFLVFRTLDILKPLGIRRLETLQGGWGVMLDDVAAGLMGAVALNVIRLIFY